MKKGLIFIGIGILLVISITLFLFLQDKFHPESLHPINESVIFMKEDISPYLNEERITILYNSGRLVFLEYFSDSSELSYEKNITPNNVETFMNVAEKLTSANCEEDIFVMDASKKYVIYIDGEEITINNPDMNLVESNCFKAYEEIEERLNFFLKDKIN
jgi:hypothetical protein